MDEIRQPQYPLLSLVTASGENFWVKEFGTCGLMETPSYHANAEPLTFDQAVIFCRRLNMRLPVPLNEESNADLHSEIRKEIFLGIRSVCTLERVFVNHQF